MQCCPFHFNYVRIIIYDVASLIYATTFGATLQYSLQIIYTKNGEPTEPVRNIMEPTQPTEPTQQTKPTQPTEPTVRRQHHSCNNKNRKLVY